MLVNQNRVLLVIIAVIVGCLVNMPQLKLKDPMMKAGAFAACLYVAYAFLNSQGLIEGVATLHEQQIAAVKRAAMYRSHQQYVAARRAEVQAIHATQPPRVAPYDTDGNDYAPHPHGGASEDGEDGGG